MTILLNQLIENYRALMTDSLPPDLLQGLEGDLAARRKAAWLRHVPRAGSRLPDLALGRAGTLSGRLARGPLVLKFYRGRWCPFCALELRAWQKMQPRLHALGAGFLAVASESPEDVALTRARDQLTFDILDDPLCHVAHQFGIAYAAGEAESSLYRRHATPVAGAATSGALCMALPALFVIDTDRIVRYAHVDADTSVRAEPGDVMRVLEQMQQAR